MRKHANKIEFFKLDPAISKFTSSLIVIKKNPSSQERENDAQSPLALSDVLLKMAVSLSFTVGQTSSHNKSDLAKFLSEHIIVNAPPDKVVVAAGGFVDEREVQSSQRAIDLSALKATHEEADTRLILHCVNSSLDNIVLSARDTDVLLLLISHVPHIPCPYLYTMSGPSTKISQLVLYPLLCLFMP